MASPISASSRAAASTLNLHGHRAHDAGMASCFTRSADFSVSTATMTPRRAWRFDGSRGGLGGFVGRVKRRESATAMRARRVVRWRSFSGGELVDSNVRGGNERSVGITRGRAGRTGRTLSGERCGVSERTGGDRGSKLNTWTWLGSPFCVWETSTRPSGGGRREEPLARAWGAGIGEELGRRRACCREGGGGRQRPATLASGTLFPARG